VAQDRRPTLTAALAIAALLALAPASGLAQIAMKSPMWAELSPHDREVLAPLAPDWDRLDAQRKQKWLGISQRYQAMKPDEQARIQEQMRPWARLTPDERRKAREQYKSIANLPPEQKTEVKQKWEEYQSLPPEQRRELATRSAPPAKIPAPASTKPGGTPAGQR
jgi:Spy/CpxP family protein refolding chaperone